MAHSAPALQGQHNLPTHATALVGRDREVADLRQLVLSDDGRLVTLTGVGGCGKTRLAPGVAASPAAIGAGEPDDVATRAWALSVRQVAGVVWVDDADHGSQRAVRDSGLGRLRHVGR